MRLFPLVAGVLWASLMADDPTVSRTETEARVKRDLAAHLKVEESAFRVDESVDQEWPDETLGCGARKGLAEPVAVPGYAFTLVYRNQRFVYHADRRGRFVRCAPPAKPLDPIR
jgi:hypothetical protein